MADRKRILIVGGVAGGASCAARARRLSESADIVIFDRGPYVSFANCGLPYYVGNVIKKEEDLLVATPDLFRQRFNIDVRLRSNVKSIDCANRRIQVNDLERGTTYTEDYDALVLSPGARPIRPELPGIDLPGIFSLRTIPDSREIVQWIEQYQARQAVVVGGGYIGMELGTVYATLGSQVVVVEAADNILTGADPDLARPIAARATRRFKEIRTKVKVLDMATKGPQIKVTMDWNGERVEELYDRVLVSVGRVPNADDLGLENTRVTRDDRGYIEVDEFQQTQDPAILAIGDIAGGVLLAHKASREARIAVERILGESATEEDFLIPAVVFTDPELTWCGVTEAEARAKGLTVEIAKFPWSASGRALTFDRPDGMTKLVIDPETERVLGVGIVGHGAGELIAEGVVAMEMGATAMDLALSVHPHPTLSETLMECAEVFYGHATHALARKRRDGAGS